MSTDHLDRLERLFRAARMHPPEERQDFLDASCADDLTLRAEVQSLLAADTEADDDAFLDTPPTSFLENVASSKNDPMEGRFVGPYKVLRPLGQGGMGAVYLAVREEPFQRYVALKIIRGGVSSPDVLRRFEQERQILASLNHPSIARLLDGGVTEDGLPFFAMEYVEGRPLTSYCDEHRLPIEERIALFRTVCEAVHYAHQNLVLHRDLKPSNILVTPEGGVKLLDFGIAKVLNPHMSQSAMPITRTALRVMTPEYASPEQVRGEPLSTASDVYSLGVILYELLTGHRPYRLTRGTADELISVVLEQDPERPSTRVVHDESITRSDGTTEIITPAAVGEARDATPERLQRRLKGDLDNIVLMALRKEPQRRYPSAEQIGHDLVNYTEGRPVEAHRDSRGYRLRKLVRRHPIESTALLALAIMLIGFAVFSEVQNRRVEEERDRAQTEADKAEQVSSFLVSLFEQADPTETLGDTLTVLDVLNEGASRIESDLDGQPEVQAEILSVIARAYANLGALESASGYFERAHGILESTRGVRDSLTTRILFELAELRSREERFAESENLYRNYVDIVAAERGTHDPSVLRAMVGIWSTLHHQGFRQQTDSLFSTLVAMEQAVVQKDNEDYAFVLTELGHAYAAMRQTEEAESHYRRALAMQRRLNPQPNPRAAYLLTRVAGVLNVQGRFDEAEPYAREAVEMNSVLFPKGHEQSASGHYNLGRTLAGLGQLDEARSELNQAVDMLFQIHGSGHRWLGIYRSALDDLEPGAPVAPHGG